MKSGKLIATCCALLVAVLMFSEAFCAETGQPDSWKTEFEQICGQTEIATALSPEELRNLISDSDELLEQLEDIEDPGAKIYIFRLRNCKAFFEYALLLGESDP